MIFDCRPADVFYRGPPKTVELLNPHQFIASMGVQYAEQLTRRLLQSQHAVTRNPRAQDFAGLEGWMAHVNDPSGLASTPGFDRYLIESNKRDAENLTPLRLFAMEHEKAQKSKAKKK